jgi:hypothetical protein
MMKLANAHGARGKDSRDISLAERPNFTITETRTMLQLREVF